MKTFVIIPTFNEIKNLPRILERIFALPLFDLFVLVVDDGSPDGTGRLAEKLKEEYPRLEVLHRGKKEGLGRAYLAGFAHVLGGGAELMVEMDCDGSHDPADLLLLLESTHDADVIVGSRYVAGGAVDYPWHRVFISRVANEFANLILRLGIKDATAGFKVYRRPVVELFLEDDFSSSGYSFQVETLLRAKKAGFKIKEIPITFTDRTQGRSKMGLGEVLQGSWDVLRLRFK